MRHTFSLVKYMKKILLYLLLMEKELLRRLFHALIGLMMLSFTQSTSVTPHLRDKLTSHFKPNPFFLDQSDPRIEISTLHYPICSVKLRRFGQKKNNFGLLLTSDKHRQKIITFAETQQWDFEGHLLNYNSSSNHTNMARNSRNTDKRKIVGERVNAPVRWSNRWQNAQDGGDLKSRIRG